MRQVSVSEAMKRKYPEWLVLVVSRDGEGQPDVMPAGWCMICSSKPPLMAVAVGKGRYTHRCIEQTGEFVLAWAGKGQGELVTYTGSHSGADADKFEALSIATSPPAATNVPLIEGCVAHLECKLHKQIETGDHSIFVGEVVAAHVPDEPIRKLENFAGNFAVAEPVSS